MSHEETKEAKLTRCRVITHSTSKLSESDYRYRPWKTGDDPLSIRTTADLLRFLSTKESEKAELDARVLGVTPSRALAEKRVEKQAFVEAFRKDIGSSIKMREDGFAQDVGFGRGLIGHDFTPLLGGPFYKNLYYYQDYIRMHAEAFFQYNNNPFARAVIQITRDFVIGTGYEVQCDLSTDDGKRAMAQWRAFEEANDLQEQIDQFTVELSMYGESMFWKLPNNQTRITYKLKPGEKPPVGSIPRVRLIDPSNIVEIITYPEDINRKLAYVWLTPTQYQIFSGGMGAAASDDQSTPVDPQPTLKFIYRQIAADQMLHAKVNSVSNEKRGRSDLFAIFNYLKRLQDAIEYSVISLQKVAAYSIDTTVDGDQTDIDAYIASMEAMGTIPDAGSDFVHSSKVKREYLGNSHAGGHTSDAFQWLLSAIAAGSGIPVSQFGTHLTGAANRASALVSTEPMAKKIEKRREIIKRTLKDLWNHVMDQAGLKRIDCDVIFPEIITQDRSAKLKDLLLAEQSNWIKPERAASMAAKELGVTNYDYNAEIEDSKEQLPELPLPLTAPGAAGPGQGAGGEKSGGLTSGGALMPEETDKMAGGLSSEERNGIKQNLNTL